MHFEYETYKLKNGMQVVLIPSKTTYSTTISAFVKSGSALETPKNQGISHFVEHMSLGATETWPTKRIFNEVIEFNGARYNGSTSKEYLRYYINIPYNKIAFGIQFIQEALYKAQFSDEIVEQERTIILDEISKYRDSIDYLNSEYIWNELFETKKGYTNDIAGTEDTVKNFSTKALKKFYTNAHSPNKVLLSVIGNFNPKNAKALINEYFRDIPKTDEIKELPEEKIKNGQIKVQPNKKTDLILTTVLTKGPSDKELSLRTDLCRYIIGSALAGPMSSRLKRRLRDKEGLLYHIGTYDSIYQKFGIQGIHYEIAPKNFEASLRILFEELKKFYEKGMRKEELEHYKEFLINRNLVQYDEIHSYGGLIRSQIFRNKKVNTLEQINHIIKDITLDEANKIIKSSLNFNDVNVVAFGKTNSKTHDIIESILRYNR